MFFLFQPLMVDEMPNIARILDLTFAMPSHCHGEIELLYVLHGGFKTKIEDTAFRVDTGQAVLVGSMQIHEYYDVLPNTKVLHVAIGPRILQNGFQELAERDFRYSVMGNEMQSECGRSIFPEMERLFISIISEIRKDFSVAQDWSIRSYVGLLAALFHRHLSLAEMIAGSRKKRIRAMIDIYNVVQHVHENYNSSITVHEAAQLSGYEVSNFCKQFKIATNMSFHKYLNAIRINASYNLLRDCSAPVFSVAETVGFPETKTFCRVFKENTGMTPNEYRRKVFGWNDSKTNVSEAPSQK